MATFVFHDPQQAPQLTPPRAVGRKRRAGPPRSDAEHAPGISRLSHKHEAILQFMVVNPDAKLGEIAAFFGVTPAWLSAIIYSDVFQAKLQQRQDEAFESVLMPMRDKITGIAHRAVDKLADAVEESEDPSFLLSASDKLLHRLGYGPTRGPSAAPSITQNNITVHEHNVDGETLRRAKTLIHRTREQREALEHASEPAPGAEPSEEAQLVE